MILPFTPEARALASLIEPDILIAASTIAIQRQHTSITLVDLLAAIDQAVDGWTWTR